MVLLVAAPAASQSLEVVGQVRDQSGQPLPGVVVELAVGGAPEHAVSIQIYTTDMEAYRTEAREIGARYRTVFGRHYPAISLFEVTRLYDPAALVEIVCTAVIP